FVLPLWSFYTLTVKSSEAKNGDQKLIGETGSKTNEKPVDQEDQAFLEELERLKRQEKEAGDVAETLGKTFVQSTEDLLLQAGAARASSTNCVNTASTTVNTASTPINTASTQVNTASLLRNPITAKNKANKTAGPKEAITSTEAKNGDQKLIGETGSKTNEKPVDQEDQAFLEELERLKRQEKEAGDVAETLGKTFVQSTEDLLLQAGAARASSTNCANTASTTVNTASTPINTASTQVNTASLLRNVSADGPSYPDLSTYANQDDYQGYL
nr:hypothetical protein [Tanacetum cinerariifolium]